MLIYGNSLFHQQVNRHGAEAARRAHNPEVTGSKPVAGIQNFQLLYRSDLAYEFRHLKPAWRRGSARGS